MPPKEIDALLGALLMKRGVSSEEERVRFLNPDYEAHLHDPFLLPDMEKAVERILRAVKENELIILYTDYDTDGTPAGVLLRDFFRKIGHLNFRNYIPHRYYEGYGLNIDALKKFKEDGATLLITADCGISNIEEVRYAEGEGMNVILTDHHLPHDELPPAYAVINPKRGDSAYPFDGLCGAGVAFKLVQALLRRGKELGMFEVKDGWEKWLLDMAGIATVADMVPLVGENRAIAHFGIKVLRKSPRPGIRALCRRLRLSQQFLGEDDIGFSIGPYINAASRMDSPIKAFEFLSAEGDEEAERLVEELGHLNDQRKGLVASIIKEIKHRFIPAEAPAVLVAGNPAWHPGLLGLSANTLSEQFARPVFLWGGGESAILKGSCRSDGTVHIVELMRKAKELFTDFGGHEFSGGFSIAREDAHKLPEALVAAYAGMERREPEPPRRPDAALSIDSVNWDLFRMLERLAPYGEGNPKPLFLFENAEVVDKTFFGKTKNHLKLVVRGQSGRRVPAIQFFADRNEQASRINIGETVSLTAHVERNIFGNKAELRLRIVEIQPGTNTRMKANDTN